MKVLLACSDNCYRLWSRSRHVGRLLIPKLSSQSLVRGFIAADNFCYSGWDEKLFFQMLLRFSNYADSLKWVAVPDVVGSWEKTRERFSFYSERIRRLGYSLAYVLQDGQPSTMVPWEEISTVFVGGTDLFKESKEALGLCLEAKERSKLVHIGRVNSVRRIQIYLGVADSIDGMTYSRFNKTHLPKLLRWLDENIHSQ